MEIKIKNLGVIDYAKINLDKNFSLFTGKNNTGKSYLNYLLYGLYKIDENEFISQINSIISKKSDLEIDNNSKIITLSFNIYEFLEKQIQQVFDIYSSILQQNIPNLFATNTIKPKIELISSDLDKHFLFELKKKEINNADTFYYTYEDLDERSGSFSLTKGILSFKTNKLANNFLDNTKWINNFLKVATKALIQNSIFEILRFMKRIVTFPNNHPANSNVYFFSAERSAINLFYEDIIQSKAKKGDNLSQIMTFEEFTKYKQTGDVSFNYPLPINDYLYYIDYLGKLNKRKSELTSLSADLEKLIGGKIKLGEYNELKFIPNNQKLNLNLHTASSTVKSFAGLVFYFTHLAKKGDTIFIDEPELNLHPDNQRLIARILAKAFNSGIKLFVSTHSDYIIRELNNLIMLNQNTAKAKKIQKKYGYLTDELIDYNSINVHLCNNNEVKSIPIDETGFEIETIDTEINLLNKVSQDIFFSLYD